MINPYPTEQATLVTQQECFFSFEKLEQHHEELIALSKINGAVMTYGQLIQNKNPNTVIIITSDFYHYSHLALQ